MKKIGILRLVCGNFHPVLKNLIGGDEKNSIWAWFCNDFLPKFAQKGIKPFQGFWEQLKRQKTSKNSWEKVKFASRNAEDSWKAKMFLQKGWKKIKFAFKSAGDTWKAEISLQKRLKNTKFASESAEKRGKRQKSHLERLKTVDKSKFTPKILGKVWIRLKNRWGQCRSPKLPLKSLKLEGKRKILV